MKMKRQDFGLWGKGYAIPGGAVRAATAQETNIHSKGSITHRIDSAGFGLVVIVSAVIIVVFALGLYLGGVTMKNKLNAETQSTARGY